MNRDHRRDLRRGRPITATAWHWLARVLLLSTALGSLLAALLTSGLVQVIAKAVLTVIVLAVGGQQAADGLQTICTQNWARFGRFAWLQYPALVVGVLVTLLPGYPLLVMLYPTLRFTPLTSMAVGLAMGLLVLVVLLLIVTVLAVLLMLLLIPFLVARSLVREHRRRAYRYPTR